MLKFKMSLLLKSMKFRVVLAVLIISAVLAGIIFIPQNRAGNISQTVQVIANASGATVNGKTYFGIKKYSEAQGYDNLFCIEEGADLWGSVTYNNPQEVSGASQYFKDYNKAMWIINNMYLYNVKGNNGLSNEAARDISALNFANLLTTNEIKTQVAQKGLTGAGNVTAKKIFDLRATIIGNTEYAKPALEVVEQIALWNYTNNKYSEVLEEYKKPENFFQNTKLTDDQQVTLKYVYYALTILADNNGGNTTSATISLKKDEAKFNESDYQVGPYYLQANGKKLTAYEFGETNQAQLPITVNITKNDGSVETKGKDIIVKKEDGSFYINLDAYKDNVKKVELKIDSILSNINTEAYVLEGGDSQNLLTIDKSVSVSNVTDGKDIVITVPEGKYKVILKKVKKDGTPIESSEAIFNINGSDKETEKGILKVTSEDVEIKNVEQEDNYTIKETKAPDGYNGVSGEMKLKVKFKEENKKFVVDEGNTTFTVDNKENKATMEISSDKTTITITVPNEEKETPPPPPETPKTGKYSVILKKVKEDGKTVIESSEAIFNVNGSDKETEKGILKVTPEDVEIKGVEQEDTYTIKETKAPDGYNGVSGEMKLKVKFKEENKKFVIDEDEDKTTFTVDNKENKATMEISSDKTTITITVPNKEKETPPPPETPDNTYKVILKKTNMNGEILEIPAIFTINGNPNTTEKGIIDVTDVTKTGKIESVDQRANYVIQETRAPEGYEAFWGYIKLDIKFKQEGKKIVIDKENTSFVIDRDGKTSETLHGNAKIEFSEDKTTIIITILDEKTKETPEEFDLALRKFISKIDGKDVTPSREPIINEQSIKNLMATGTASYYHVKESVNVNVGAEVEYTIRVYNEGKKLGYAKQITDYLPEGLTFVKVADESKKLYSVDAKEGSKAIVIKYNGNAVIKSLRDFFNKKEINVTNEYYQEVKIICKVQNSNTKYVTSRSEITNYGYEDKNENGETIWKEATTVGNVDKDSAQNTIKDSLELNTWYETAKERTYVDENGKTVVDKNYYPGAEDDDDFETIELVRDFDMALSKYITEVNGNKLSESREPQVDVSELVSGKATTAKYNHSKTPVDVNTSDIVTYTIRVYNEGEVDGYAAKIMDDIPQGLEFIAAKYDKDGKAENVNAQYKWKIYKEAKAGESTSKENTIEYNKKIYVLTDKVEEADLIVTDYLSKENGKNNLIKAFDKSVGKMTEDNWRDVKVSFKVVEPESSDRIVTNSAQITEHTDSNGKPVTDRDSTPNVWEKSPRDDDQDVEHVKVRVFDLALRKWVTKAIVYENGYETVTETKHQPWDNPEPVVKVDLKNTNIDNVEVKFEYTIRVYNQGEVEGYAKEISDYIPQGLKFVESDNPDWKQVDGKIVTTALENTLLKKDEYADVKVVLTWINGTDNFGVKTNTAEISKDYNKFGTPDKDSTPNNKVPGEDDIDDAPVILTISTGAPIIYTGIAVAAIAIISLGIVVIRKRVLK